MAKKQSKKAPPKKSAKSNNAVEVKEQAPPPAVETNGQTYGNEEADHGDIIIPSILLMQGTSKWVPEQFNQGDIIHSVNEEKVGGKDEPVAFLPFLMRKTWQIFWKQDENNQKWVREEPWNAANDNLDWRFEEEDEENGMRSLYRQRTYSFFSFLQSDLDGGFPVPVRVSFKSSAGFKPGKKIASHFAMMKGVNQPPHNVVWSIEPESVKEPGKSYQRYIVKKVANATTEQMAQCENWLKLLSTAQNIKTHDVDENTTGEQTVAPASHSQEATVGETAEY